MRTAERPFALALDETARELFVASWGGEVLEIRGANHYVFMSHETETLSAIRSFLARRLKRGAIRLASH